MSAVQYLPGTAAGSTRSARRHDGRDPVKIAPLFPSDRSGIALRRRQQGASAFGWRPAVGFEETRPQMVDEDLRVADGGRKLPS